MRLFSRRIQTSTTESVASSASNRDSTDGDYVLPEKPIYNIPASSASKLRLPFRRRQHPPEPTQTVYSLNDAPPRISSVMSDSGHGLPPPPRKSAVFGVHNQSAHSLPSDSSSLAHSDTPTRPSPSQLHSPPPPQPHKKSTGLFSWARERTKSKASQPPPTVSSPPLSTPPVDPSSFNLKSFRHVLPDSPTSPPEQSLRRSPLPLSDSLLAPPRPRPRGSSVASDSSQRISVAAFREAHARSRANSPAPSFRPPSTADTLRVDVIGRKRASTVSVVSVADCSRPSKSPPLMPSPRPVPSAPDSSSDSESSEDDEDVDSDGEPIPKPAQKPTAVRRPEESPARTNPGLRSVSTHTDPHALPPPIRSDQAPLSRTRASLSTSALTPSAAARRASILAGTNSSSPSHAPSRHQARKPRDDTDESTDSSDTDSEDMPLSAPRRPGSAASNSSNTRPRMPPKPLIDINTLATRRPLLTPVLRHENSVKNFHKKDKESDLERDQPFSVPAVLAISTSPSPPITPPVTKQNPASAAKPVSTAHNPRSSSDVPVLPKPKEPDNDDDLINAIRLVGTLDKEKDPDQPSVMSPSDRIIPTHIRAREPPTSFTVLSRPHRQSTAERSTSPSSTSATHSTASPVSPQPELGARQRASTMVNSLPQKDKSDTMSIASVARSSRTSRIPPVPLIHSIPDSPSLEEEYKSGRPRSVSGTSALNASQIRSQPPPPMPVSAMKPTKAPPRGFQSSMPRRPFASNSSVAGESPAGSSTGDSSSGRSPFTPRDGSDVGMRSKDDASDPGSTLKARHVKKHSVTFEDQIRGRERPKTATDEQRTRERRRSEAKAAFELGKIVNGRGPLNDDSDEDRRNPTISVTTEDGAPAQWGWQQPMATGVFPQQFGNDPAYLAAHQRALLVAKQAYQMAVAQHAMQMAGDEWERTSNAGFSGGSVYGGGSGGSVYGGGSGGSVYGRSGGSVYGGGGGMPMGMMGMPSMGMLMPPNPWAARSSVAFPSAAPVYGVSSSQSEYGGGWGTQSVYGDSFGSSSRMSFVGGAGNGTSVHGGSRPRAWTGAAPPPSSSQPPRVPAKGAVRGQAAPPSSWKSGR